MASSATASATSKTFGAFEDALETISSASAGLAGGASVPKGPTPLYFQSYLDDSTLALKFLPFQQRVLGDSYKIDDEFARITASRDTIARTTIGTIFICRDYSVMDQQTIVLNSFKPLYQDVFTFIKNLEPKLRANVDDVTDYCQYVFDTEDDAENGRRRVEEIADIFKPDGIVVDVEKICTVAEVKEDPTAPANYFKYIKSTFPVPKIEDTGFYIDNDIWQLLVRNVLRNTPTLLTGPTGSGKTELMSFLSGKLGKALRIEDMGTITDAQTSLQGVHRINSEGVSEFELAPFAEFLTQPGIILLDELSRAPLSTGNMLLPCLDSRRYLPIDAAGHGASRHIEIHPDAVFFATANIGAEYSGTMQIDAALINRLMPVEMSYPAEAIERKVLLKRVSGLEDKQAGAIVNVAKSIRKQYGEQELSNTMSMRHTLLVSQLVADGMELHKALLAVLMPLFEGGTGTNTERMRVKGILSAH